MFDTKGGQLQWVVVSLPSHLVPQDVHPPPNTVRFMVPNGNCAARHTWIFFQGYMHRMVSTHIVLHVWAIGGLPSLDNREHMFVLFPTHGKWNSTLRQNQLVRILIQIFSMCTFPPPPTHEYSSLNCNTDAVNANVLSIMNAPSPNSFNYVLHNIGHTSIMS